MFYWDPLRVPVLLGFFISGNLRTLKKAAFPPPSGLLQPGLNLPFRLLRYFRHVSGEIDYNQTVAVNCGRGENGRTNLRPCKQIALLIQLIHKAVQPPK